jgi:hypothetical protein
VPPQNTRASSSCWASSSYFFEADLLDADFRGEDFLFVDLRADLLAGLRPEDFFAGTLAPSRRASDSPIAIACFLLVTFFPERPLLSVPRLRSCIARLTFELAFRLYLAICSSFSHERHGQRASNAGAPPKRARKSRATLLLQ